MNSKMLVFAFVGNLLFLIQAMTSSENIEYLSALNGTTTMNHTVKQDKGEQPVVIHTQAKYYDQPTLKEYQECHENLEKCRKVCEGLEHVFRCLQECPICPLLIKEQILVQGINDTRFSPVTTAPLNTTNIIRLTNEIRNIIETYQGNITNFNENKVHVQQNISKIGGQFGLGYNNTESCCIVISPSKNCEMKKFTTVNRCHRKRHRVCGSKCKSRLMLAKRVTICENPAFYSSKEDYGEENCRETVKYVPYHLPKREPARLRNRCSFSPSWPYVSCSENSESFHHSMICKHCLGIPYYYILRRGMREVCIRCFMTYASPITKTYTPSWHSDMPPDMEGGYLVGDNINYKGSWQQDKTSCRLPDGTISDKCQVKVGDFPSTIPDPSEILPDAMDEYMEHDIDFGEVPRKRRHTFTRSKYSHRYR